ncbi:MAG: N-acetylmuramoyl-L-alanine amidase [Verrucomicrobia bacterium]|nr:N-acetylmuramoyl-L-alanine amidase [Verrucomicrobiota bacterium]
MRCLRVFCLFLCVWTSAGLLAAPRRAPSRSMQGCYDPMGESSPGLTKPLIVLDAGHGGDDHGAKIQSFLEKKATLQTAILTKKHLEELGYRVLMTRSRDVYLPLQRRVAIANKTKGSLFVSVHFNSSPSTAAHGIEVFFYNSKEAWRTRASKRLADCILYRVIDETDAHSRGVKQGNFHVIRETQMPSVLVEGGFITNSEERAKLRDKGYLDRLAAGIAQGIDKYMKT